MYATFQKLPTTLVTTAAMMLLVVGCSPEQSDDSDAGGINFASDAADDAGTDAREDTSEESDTGTDASLENDAFIDDPVDGSSDGGGENGDRQITDFTYRRINQESCRAGCAKGASVNFTTGRVEDVEDGTHWEMTEDELDTLRRDFLGETTRDKMLDGWQCGDTDVYMGGRYEFEATIGTGADSLIETRTVTGCIPDDSDQPDADKVQAIRDELIRLRNKYDPS